MLYSCLRLARMHVLHFYRGRCERKSQHPKTETGTWSIPRLACVCCMKVDWLTICPLPFALCRCREVTVCKKGRLCMLFVLTRPLCDSNGPWSMLN